MGTMKTQLLFTLVLLMIMLLLCTSGCWDRIEPDEVVVVTAAAFDIDRDSGLLRAIVQLINPLSAGSGQQEGGAGGGQKSPLWIIEATGHTAAEAVQNLELFSPRRLLWTHIQTLLFSEELARRSIRPVLDFFSRERESRLIVQPFVVQGDVRELLQADFPLEKSGGTALRKQFLTTRFESSVVPEVDSLRLLFQQLNMPGRELILPRAAVLEEKEKGKNSDKSGMLNPVRISGAAVFRGEKLAGFLDERETSGYLWVTGNLKSSILILKCPDSESALLSVVVYESTAELKPEINGDEVRFKVLINAEGHIQDYACPEFPEEEKSFIASLNRRMTAVIRNEIALSLEKARELGSDIFGLGNVIYRTQPREWKNLEKNWQEIFPRIMFDIEVNAVIRRAGLIGEPIKNR